MISQHFFSPLSSDATGISYQKEKAPFVETRREGRKNRTDDKLFFSSCDLDQLFSSKHTHTQNTIRFVQLMRIKFLVKRDWKGVDCVKVSKVSKFSYFLFLKIFKKKNCYQSTSNKLKLTFWFFNPLWFHLTLFQKKEEIISKRRYQNTMANCKKKVELHRRRERVSLIHAYKLFYRQAWHITQKKSFRIENSFTLDDDDGDVIKEKEKEKWHRIDNECDNKKFRRIAFSHLWWIWTN